MLPEIKYEGIRLVYKGMHLERFYFCPLVMPIGFLLGILIPRTSAVMFLLGPIVFVTFIWFNLSGIMTAAGPGVIIAALLASWLSFVVVLRWHCMLRCLVGAGR